MPSALAPVLYIYINIINKAVKFTRLPGGCDKLQNSYSQHSR